jgi:Uma2 family endonuclease
MRDDARIRHMPNPRQATVEDLYRVEQKAEIVGGELVLMPESGGLSAYAAGEVFASLRQYARRTGRGYALPEPGFVVRLPNRLSFAPDVAFTTTRMLTGKFIEGAPILAVEVRGDTDYGLTAERAIAAKRADYFAAGTRVVWDVDVLQGQFVRVYRADRPSTPTVYRRGQHADAEPALPGWSMPVDDLFPASQG